MLYPKLGIRSYSIINTNMTIVTVSLRLLWKDTVFGVMSSNYTSLSWMTSGGPFVGGLEMDPVSASTNLLCVWSA